MITAKLNVYAVFIFIGALQALILAFYFIFKKGGNRLSHYTLAFILICFTLILFDICSGYSGYIIYYIYLNNFSDPIVFFLGPLCYLYTKSVAQHITHMGKKQYLHFIIPLFMLLYFVPYFLQPDGLKYNDFLSAFHPDIKTVYVNPVFEPDPFGFLRNIVILMVSHLSVYVALSIRLINKILAFEGSSFFSFTSSTLAPLRVLLSGFVFALVVFAVIKLVFYNDLGDHIIATYTSIIVYSITIYLVGQKYLSTDDEQS
jgi:hypothetical protein